MAVHQYWRVFDIRGYGNGLTITEAQLFSAQIRVDASIALTASIAPASGALADLQDGAFTSPVTWASVKGLTLNWDFGGAPVDCQEVRFGAYTEITNWIRSYALQFSDDNVTWTANNTTLMLAWPGGYSMSQSGPQCTWDIASTSPGNRAAFALNWPRTTATLRAHFAGNIGSIIGTQAKSSGVMQFEVTIPPTAAGIVWHVGVTQVPVTLTSYPGQAATSWAVQLNTTSIPSGNKITNATGTAFVSFAVMGTGPFWLGVVVDFTAGSITYYKNGVALGVAWAGLSLGSVVPALGSNNGAATTAAVGQSFTLNTRLSEIVYPIAGATMWHEYAAAVEGYAGVELITDTAMFPFLNGAQPPVVPPVDPVTGRLSAVPTTPNSSMRGDFINYNGSLHSVLLLNAAGYNSAFGTLSGYVTRDGVPSQDKIVVLRMNDWRVMWVGMSDPKTGFWKTTELIPDVKYVAFAIDHSGNYRAIVWDQMLLDPA